MIRLRSAWSNAGKILDLQWRNLIGFCELTYSWPCNKICAVPQPRSVVFSPTSKKKALATKLPVPHIQFVKSLI